MSQDEMETISKDTASISIDVNSTEFYDDVHEEIDADLARIKKCVDIVQNLRMTAAEMEVETAALHHAELFQNIEKLKSFEDECSEDVKHNQN